MKRIENVAIVGMGALGLLFGQKISENLGNDTLCYLMDAERKVRHSNDIYRINGKTVSFRMAAPEEMKSVPGQEKRLQALTEFLGRSGSPERRQQTKNG